MKPELLLRVIVIEPPPNVTFALQRGKADLLAPVSVSDDAIAFEFPVLVADAKSDPVRLTGEFTQGAPRERFVYINSGTMAGQPDSCWTRRAKVPLTGIHGSLVRAALDGSGAILEARILDKSRDGGPCCASVPLQSGWVHTGA